MKIKPGQPDFLLWWTLLWVLIVTTLATIVLWR